MAGSAPPELAPSRASAREEATEHPTLNIAPGAVIGGKYRLTKPLRQGGMGSVWVATHLALDTPVAVKFMLINTPPSPEPAADSGSGKVKATPTSSSSIESRGRFEREAKVVAQIRSANVVQVLDYGVDQGAQYIVMELLDGEDLGAHLKRTIRMPLAEVSRLVVAIARALQRAHDAGLVHRDLKPPNVFLAREGDEMVPKVLDFGVAKALIHDRPVNEGTLEGTLVGTPSYMSPEQATARATIDHRADLWSLGVIIYRAITGVRPFESESLLELVVQICSQRPVPPSKHVAGLPPAIDVFMAKALDRDPNKRFQTARDMARALVAIVPPRSSMPPAKLSPADAEPAASDDATRQIAMPHDSGDDILTVMAPSETSPDGPISGSFLSHPSAPRVPVAAEAGTPIEPIKASSPAVAPGGRRGMLIAALAGGLLSLAVIGGLLIRASHTEHVNPPNDPPIRSANVPSAAAPPVSVITPPSASVAPAVTPALSASVAPPPASVEASAKVRPPPPKVDCSTPFYWDKNGTKFIKPQCL